MLLLSNQELPNLFSSTVMGQSVVAKAVVSITA